MTVFTFCCCVSCRVSSRFTTRLSYLVACKLLFGHEEGGNAIHLVVFAVLVNVFNHFFQPVRQFIFVGVLLLQALEQLHLLYPSFLFIIQLVHRLVHY